MHTVNLAFNLKNQDRVSLLIMHGDQRLMCVHNSIIRQLHKPMHNRHIYETVHITYYFTQRFDTVNQLLITISTYRFCLVSIRPWSFRPTGKLYELEFYLHVGLKNVNRHFNKFNKNILCYSLIFCWLPGREIGNESENKISDLDNTQELLQVSSVTNSWKNCKI